MSAITFDPSFGYGTIITIALLLAGFVGNWYTQKFQVTEAVKRHSELETKVAVIDSTLADHKLHISETYVRRDDIDKLEERISKMFGSFSDGLARRIETVEHTMRNIDQKILAIVQMNNKGRKDD